MVGCGIGIGIGIVYGYGKLFAQAARHESEGYTAYCDAEPEASGCHAAGEAGAVTDADHEGDDPASEC